MGYDPNGFLSINNNSNNKSRDYAVVTVRIAGSDLFYYIFEHVIIIELTWVLLDTMDFHTFDIIVLAFKMSVKEKAAVM